MAVVTDGMTFDTFSEFIEKLSDLCPHFVWRGVSDFSYEVKPRVGWQYEVPSDTDGERHFRDREITLFEMFKAKSKIHLEEEPACQFEWLALAQHYGVPTRLLDWTENPLIALYFSVCSNPDHEDIDGALIAFHRSGFYSPNEINPLDPKLNGFVLAPYVTQRLAAQAAVLSVQIEPWKEFVPDGETDVVKCKVTPRFKKEFKGLAPKLGLTKSTLFADLDSYAKDIERVLEASRCKNSEGELKLLHP